MRNLATIRTVAELKPIEGADLIELALVDGWQCVVKKNEYRAGEQTIYCEVDSFLPLLPQYEFLRKSSYKKLADGTEGFRLKTMKLRGQLSQGLLLPLATLGAAVPADPQAGWQNQENVTQALGITKYEPPVPASLSGLVKGNFPAWLPKTDEERVQNCWPLLPKDVEYVATEKLDGTSVTFYLKDGEFGVCSRNLDLQEEGGTTYWKVARELNLETKLRAYAAGRPAQFGVAVQGEIIGEGIAGNYYRIAGHKFHAFNFFDEQSQGYVADGRAEEILTGQLGLAAVPRVSAGPLPPTLGELLRQAEGPSVYPRQAVREGLVLRHYPKSGPRISCKVLSNEFLLKEK